MGSGNTSLQPYNIRQNNKTRSSNNKPPKKNNFLFDLYQAFKEFGLVDLFIDTKLLARKYYLESVIEKTVLERDKLLKKIFKKMEEIKPVAANYNAIIEEKERLIEEKNGIKDQELYKEKIKRIAEIEEKMQFEKQDTEQAKEEDEKAKIRKKFDDLHAEKEVIEKFLGELYKNSQKDIDFVDNQIRKFHDFKDINNKYNKRLRAIENNLGYYNLSKKLNPIKIPVSAWKKFSKDIPYYLSANYALYDL